jgi:hypothetical protein
MAKEYDSAPIRSGAAARNDAFKPPAWPGLSESSIFQMARLFKFMVAAILSAIASANLLAFMQACNDSLYRNQ